MWPRTVICAKKRIKRHVFCATIKPFWVRSSVWQSVQLRLMQPINRSLAASAHVSKLFLGLYIDGNNVLSFHVVASCILLYVGRARTPVRSSIRYLPARTTSTRSLLKCRRTLLLGGVRWLPLGEDRMHRWVCLLEQTNCTVLTWWTNYSTSFFCFSCFQRVASCLPDSAKTT